MSGIRAGRARAIAMGVALALALLLIGVDKAGAGKYAVAQCGWHLGADAAWADTTGGAKFRPDAYCATPPGADPFDGAHLKSFTRQGPATVSGTRFARWRWTAPPGTGIVQVRGTWWHALHDGFQQRVGTDAGDGGFAPFGIAAATDVAPRDFAAGFSPPQHAFEDRLLCARGTGSFCSLSPASWSALRALTITVEDDAPPAAGLGGALLGGGWQRGSPGIVFWAGDLGGGARLSETFVDGARVDLTEHPCAKAMIGGEWRATQMMPCQANPVGTAGVDTTRFSDGPHSVHHCVTDFAGNVGCTAASAVAIDNNPPTHPRSAHVAGGDGWRRDNRFDVAWANPGQGAASPIRGALWRVTGAAGYDSGVKSADGRDVAAIAAVSVPAPGSYTLHVWLRDEAGNSSPATAVEVPLRFDGVPPGLAFVAEGGTGTPRRVRAALHDDHSGPAGGEIAYRRLGSDSWKGLEARFERGDGTDSELVARVPESLAPGIYVFRAEAVDAAGNSAATTRRADGTEMTVRVPAPRSAGRAGERSAGHAARRGRPRRGRARLFAALRWRGRRGRVVTVPFGSRARLAGRLVDADGAGLRGRRIRLVMRYSRGALARRLRRVVRTGRHGGFRLRLPPGPSRRVTVLFGGDRRLRRARRAPLSLRVRSGVVLRAAPLSLRTGETVHLTGRVRARGAPLPRRGKLVAVQYREAATGRWRPVLVTRTDHSGRFRARYRFRYVRGRARIRLRAVALPEERWPYASGASGPLAVRVSG